MVNLGLLLLFYLLIFSCFEIKTTGFLVQKIGFLKFSQCFKKTSDFVAPELYKKG